ncbi:MAG: hypothetical protein SVR04_18450, partial [Spirochaetota bacterium]|nr:hypothetical protein [Spirochaetota bacterium]
VVTANYDPPREINIQLGHKDVNLEAFEHGAQQYAIKKLTAGDRLYTGRQKNALFNSSGRLVLYFSKRFSSEIEEKWINKGYFIDSAQARFILVWKDKADEKECRIVLPNLRLIKKMN